MAEERDVSKKARDMAWREPICEGRGSAWPLVGRADVGCSAPALEAETSTSVLVLAPVVIVDDAGAG